LIIASQAQLSLARDENPVATAARLKEIADTLHKRYAARGYKIHTLQFPVFLVRVLALFDKKVARVADDLNWDFQLSGEKIKRVLKWSPRPAEEAILSMAESLIEQGLVQKL